MKQGRELDVLIATHVFKWKKAVSVPKYSEHIEDAWKIVEKYRRKWDYHIGAEGGVFSCYIYHQFEGMYNEHGTTSRQLGVAWSGESAPHAICLATLHALEVLEQEKY